MNVLLNVETHVIEAQENVVLEAARLLIEHGANLDHAARHGDSFRKTIESRGRSGLKRLLKKR
ncbi:MAG: hypothetical protein AB8B91_08400 [Rubripirellula sp.]